MNAEQYRALVNKLEALQEAPTEPEQSAMNVASANFQPADASAAPTQSATTTPAPAPAADPNQIPTIEAPTFSQAYAKARAQKLKKFKWCGVYAVKDPVNPQPVVPPKTGGIQPAVYVPPIQPGGGIANQNQADTLNLVAAGNMGA
jgi:hypothetical protein